MKIDGINNLNNLPNNKSADEKKVNLPKETRVEPAATYEKGKEKDTSHVYDRASIERLKKESENVYGQLKQMVEEMLQKQGKTLDLLKPGEMVNIGEAQRAKAKEMIGPDGPLGIEAMSDSIVQFAKAASGGDKNKLDTLRGAIEKGFREAERILGGLPDISLKTYDRIMEKLDKWENE